MKQNRRSFLGVVGGLTAAGVFSRIDTHAHDAASKPLHIACNEYSWITFYRRNGDNWSANLDTSLREFKQSGIPGYEPSVKSAAELDTLSPLLKKYGVEMRSIYVGCVLHTEEGAAESIDRVISIAKAAKLLGVKILVTNPNPVSWNGPGSKTDAELERQAKNLNQLGEALRQAGITLAYHNHDKEMQHGARELHHMMLATDPRNVSLCFEAHWLYRGAGNSQVAMFDVLKLYGKRVVEVHLRQSKEGVWSETFGDGDIDYGRLARELESLKVRPHFVLEQCIEKASPHTIEAVAAHQEDLKYASRIFGSPNK